MREPALVPVMDEWRQQAEASLMFHMQRASGGFNWAPAVPSLVTRFFDTVGDPRTAADALANDVNSLFALTDNEIAQKVANGERIGEMGDVWDAVADVAWEVGAREVATRMTQEKSTSVKGKFEALTGPDIQAIIGDPAPGPRPRPNPQQSQLAEVFSRPGAWSYDQGANILAVTIGEGDDTRTVGVRPGAGFRPDNTLDVLTEVVRAFNSGDQTRVFGELDPDGLLISEAFEVVSDVGRWIEDHPAARDFVDGLWQGFQGRTPASEGPSELEEIRSEQAATKTEQIKLAGLGAPFPEEMFVAVVADALQTEGKGLGVDLPDAMALSMAGELVKEDKDKLADDWQALTSEQLIEDIEAQFDDGSPLATAIDRKLESVLEVFNAWDSVTQTLGVAFVDLVGDTLDVANKSLTLDATFEDFKEIFVTLPDADTVGDYFGLKGGAYDAANLATSIFFDPVNAVFPGAKGARALFYRAMTNPKFAPMYLAAPSVRSVTKEIAEQTGRNAISNVLYLDGLSDDGYRRLLDLAAKDGATVKEVDEVLLGEISNGYFLGAGPHRAIRSSTVEGMGRMVDTIASGKLNDQQLGTVLTLFADLNRTRTFTVGENVGLANFFDLLHQFFPTDADGMLKWAREATEAMNKSGEVPNAAVQGVLTMQKQQARQEVAKTQAIRRRSGRDPDGIKENIFEVDSSLAQVDELEADDAVKEQVREALRAQRAHLQRELETVAPVVEQGRNAVATAHRQLAKTTRAEADLVVGRDRAAIADVLYRFYDDLAGQINKEFGEDVIPILRDARGAVQPNPLAPEVPLRDWSAVTGSRRNNITEDNLALVMGLAVDDPVLMRELSASGLFARNQKVLLPASPYEVMLFRKIANNPAAWAKVTNAMRQNRLSGAIRTIKLAFGTNLLMNPITAGKVTFDETFRFMATEGQLGKFARATLAGLPGSAAIYRGLGDTLRQIPGLKTFISDDFGEFITNPYALQYSRGHGGFIGNEAYEWVTPATKGISSQEYLRHAERWVNGTLLNDPIFRAYATHALGDDVVLNPAGGLEMP